MFKAQFPKISYRLASVRYAVSWINKEEKKRKSIESMQKRSSRRCKSHSFSILAVQLYVSENKNAAKGKLAKTAAKTSLTSPLWTMHCILRSVNLWLLTSGSRMSRHSILSKWFTLNHTMSQRFNRKLTYWLEYFGLNFKITFVIGSTTKANTKVGCGTLCGRTFVEWWLP
jgi:hypothetical protein